VSACLSLHLVLQRDDGRQKPVEINLHNINLLYLYTSLDSNIIASRCGSI
jgi:hypothetical protein